MPEKDFKIPYNCQRCQKQSKENFAFHKETNTYITVFPEDNMIHLHYGHATHSDKINIREAHFVHDTFFSYTKKYPDKKFFIVLDASQADDSEFVPTESMKLYRNILKDHQLKQGVVCGATTAFAFLLRLLFKVTKRNIKIVHTMEEVEDVYKKWLSQQF